MSPTKFQIWKYRAKNRWLVLTPGKLKVYDFPTWKAAIRFVNTVIAGKQV